MREYSVIECYYAGGGGNSVPMIWENQLVPSSWVKKKNRLLEMGLIGCPETSARTCHYLLRNSLE